MQVPTKSQRTERGLEEGFFSSVIACELWDGKRNAFRRCSRSIFAGGPTGVQHEAETGRSDIV